MFKQAIKQEAKLRLAIAGPSGSGKHTPRWQSQPTSAEKSLWSIQSTDLPKVRR